ncbi:MAG: calcium-binding protein, partial [Methylophilaceae bacterium]
EFITLIGGAGNDLYKVDNAGDVVTELAGQGTDTVESNITYSIDLLANLENITLTGSGNINATGNATANTLLGNAGNNILNGGAGNDVLKGGAGNDIYVVDATGDAITENASEGTDTVQSSITYTIASQANLENITLTGTANINATGNAAINTLLGNTGANILDGGAGADILKGDAGDDTYLIDDAGDAVTENSNAGMDLIKVSIATASGTYTLAANVENALLTNTVAFTLTGNTLDNAITGNGAVNTLNGGGGHDTLDGGVGADILAGGAGNDVYIVDNSGDATNENASEGTDAVRSSLAWTLGANLENLTLLGTATINGTGNALSNFLSGNTGINTLDGLDGNDILQGLAGADTLNDAVGKNVYDGGAGNDIITASVGNDIIIGGAGNDTITAGSGYDVISFNKGDGQDTINISSDANLNTLSLGGAFAYSDLSLTKTGNNLILKVGTTDQITLKDWYATAANKSVANLQVIAEAVTNFSLGSADQLRNNKIENFNFTNLVAAYDTTGAPANWALTDAILTTHLKTGSDTSAMGGDLAYQYGRNSNLTGVGLIASQNVINSSSFGQSAQTLNSPTTWQAETIKLG